MSETKLYALLIGVDGFHFEQVESNKTAAQYAHGSNDVKLIESILLKKLLSVPTRVYKLSSASDYAENENNQPPVQPPTYENLLNAIQEITDLAEHGDNVLIHYSGPGGQIPTAYPQINGVDGLDQVILLKNRDSPTVHYLRDVDLASRLISMDRNGVNVTLVLDSGLSLLDVEFDEAPAAVRDEWHNLILNNQTDPQRDGIWATFSTGFALITACSPTEYAYTHCDETNRRYGALSHSLYSSLNELFLPSQTYQSLFDRVRVQVVRRFPMQTPRLIGGAARVVFSGVSYTAVGLPILAVDRDRVCIGVGAEDGVQQGARFDLYAPRDATVLTDRLLAMAIEVNDKDSRLSVPEQLSANTVAADHRAVYAGTVVSAYPLGMLIRRRNTSILRRIFRWIIGSGPLELLEEVVETAGSPFLRLTAETQQRAYQIIVENSGHYEISHGAEWPFHDSLRRGSITNREDAQRLVRQLIHLSKFKAVQDVLSPDTSAEHTSQVDAQIEGRLCEFDSSADVLNSSHLRSVIPIGSQFPRSCVHLSIKNRSNDPISIVIMHLRSDYGIEQIFPSQGSSLGRLEVGEILHLSLRELLSHRDDTQESILKIFATTEAVNLRCLELPSLRENPTTSTDDQISIAIPVITNNAMEQLVSAMSDDQAATRYFAGHQLSHSRWSTITLTLHTKESVEILNDRARQFYTFGQYKQAITLLDKALDLAKSLPDGGSIVKQLQANKRAVVSAQEAPTQGFEEAPQCYVPSEPATGKLFYGRSKNLQIILRNLTSDKSPDDFTLRGAHRTGITSLLRQVRSELIDVERRSYTPLLVDFETLSEVRGIDDLLYELALQMSKELNAQSIKTPIPERNSYNFRPTEVFEHTFLKNIFDALGFGQSLLLMIDNFDRIKDWIEGGQLDPEILDYLRSLMVHKSVAFLLGGTQRMRRLTEQYHAQFNTTRPLEIDPLTPAETRGLITEPIKDYYSVHPEATENIVRETGCHPYFTQLVCYELLRVRNEVRTPMVGLLHVEEAMRRVLATGKGGCGYMWSDKSRTFRERLILSLVTESTQEGIRVSEDDIMERLKFDVKDHVQRLIEDGVLCRSREQEFGRSMGREKSIDPLVNVSPSEAGEDLVFTVPLFQQWLINRHLDTLNGAFEDIWHTLSCDDQLLVSLTVGTPLRFEDAVTRCEQFGVGKRRTKIAWDRLVQSQICNVGPRKELLLAQHFQEWLAERGYNDPQTVYAVRR
ncbi:MAG: caspase family protein [Nitrospira sp.]|nr:caspase family protein [Nitrospira sp.]